MTTGTHFQDDDAMLKRRIAWELQLMHHRVEKLEAALSSPKVLSALSEEPTLFTAMQELDQLMQATRALSDFCLERGLCSPPDLAASLKRIPLADMAMRLAGAEKETLPRGHDELFG